MRLESGKSQSTSKRPGGSKEHASSSVRRSSERHLSEARSTPWIKEGDEYKNLWEDSDPSERNANGRTRSGLYRIFIPADEALEGFFDKYGNPVTENPTKPVEGVDGEIIDQGSREYLKNERDSLKHDPSELNEIIRQFPLTEDEAFRDSIEGSIFNIGKIYQQIDWNNNMFPNPVVTGNFIWKEKDKEVVFSPDPRGRFHVSWMPPKDRRNVVSDLRGKKQPPFPESGVGGVDSYDLDETVDGRGSKGALHLYNKFSMNDAIPGNMFVLEYASRPDLASVFYEDVLMAAFFYGYPLLVENNKYGIVRYFEKRGYDGYIMDRPKHLTPPGARVNTRTKGIPSNSVDVIQAHAHAIEAYIHDHVGVRAETDNFGNMYFNRTLEDWIGYKISNRTKYDLTISSGLALLGAQKAKVEKQVSNFNAKKFFRRSKPKEWHR